MVISRVRISLFKGSVLRRSFNYLLQFHLGSLVSFPRVPGSGSATGGVVLLLCYCCLLLSAVAVLWCAVAPCLELSLLEPQLLRHRPSQGTRINDQN